MERTTISLPEELLQRLRVIAAQRGVSMASIIREAIEEKTAQQRPKPKSIGIIDSGRSDLSEQASNIVLDPPSWR